MPHRTQTQGQRLRLHVHLRPLPPLAADGLQNLATLPPHAVHSWAALANQAGCLCLAETSSPRPRMPDRILSRGQHSYPHSCQKPAPAGSGSRARQRWKQEQRPLSNAAGSTFQTPPARLPTAPRSPTPPASPRRRPRRGPRLGPRHPRRRPPPDTDPGAATKRRRRGWRRARREHVLVADRRPTRTSTRPPEAPPPRGPRGRPKAGRRGSGTNRFRLLESRTWHPTSR
mmetsp:Transcript_52731/g.171490  ORF Transcript_52731/g.171490 Transcript_52731/m.171490 type:complete len:229 (-) Transcript_52731:355-1041(-)